MKTRGELSSAALVGLIIAAVSLVSLFFLYVKTASLADDLDTDVLQCRQNAILAWQISGNDVFEEQVRQIATQHLEFVCPVDYIDVKLENLKGKVKGEDKAIFKELDYVSDEEYQLDLLVWDEFDDCYSKVFYGESALFKHKVLSSLTKESQTFCVVCSVFDFDKEVSAKYSTQRNAFGLAYYKKNPLTKKSLYEHTTDHLSKSFAFLDMEYIPKGTKAVVYMRNNKALADDTAIAFYTGFHNWAAGAIESVTATVSFDAISVSIGRENPIKTNSIEEIRIIDYDDPFVFQSKCDILAAEVEA